MTEDTSEATEEKARKLGITALELRALIKPLFLALHKNNRTSITIERHGVLAKVDIR